MAFSFVPVRGSWSNSDDGVAKGSVTFIPTAAMDNQETIPASPVVAVLVNGAIEVLLAANDDPGTTPANVTYHVIEVINDVVRKYVIKVRSADTEIDLPSVEKGQIAPEVVWPAIWGP